MKPGILTVFSYHVMSEQANWTVRLCTNHYSSKCPMRHLLIIFVNHLNKEKMVSFKNAETFS